MVFAQQEKLCKYTQQKRPAHVFSLTLELSETVLNTREGLYLMLAICMIIDVGLVFGA